MPALFSVALGAIMLAVFWIGGYVGEGLGAFGTMIAMGMVFLVGGRSETIRGLRGDGRDERFAMIDRKATAVAGFAVILAVIIGFLVEVGEGHSGSPYTMAGCDRRTRLHAGDRRAAIADVKYRTSTATIERERLQPVGSSSSGMQRPAPG